VSKILRIAAKDISHLKLEILIALALVIGFAATGHFGWPQFPEPFSEAKTLQVWIQILMPVSWWLLIARAVHDESLVGDRQFWITRPYGWPRVLGAKLIFIALFILLPYFLAQCFLLHQAGLHPLLVLPGLAFTLLMLFGFVLLPLMALSTVTATVTKMFVIFFVFVLYAALVTYLGSLMGTSEPRAPGSGAPYMETLWLIPIVAIVVTLLQYARRRTTLSITLLIAVVVAITAACFAEALAPHRHSVFHALAAGETSPLNVAIDPDPQSQDRLSDASTFQSQSYGEGDSQYPVNVPLIVSGIVPGHVVNLDAQTVTFTSPGMQARTTPWMQVMTQFGINPVISGARRNVNVPPWIFNEFSGKTVTIHITYAATELEAESPTTVSFNRYGTDIPQNGRCTDTGDPSGIHCQYALTDPDLTHVTWTLQQSCTSASPQDVAREQWIGTIRPGIEDAINPALRSLDFNPVDTLYTSLEDRQPGYRRGYRLCPGTPFIFTKYHIVRRRMVEVTLPPLDLRTYIDEHKHFNPEASGPAHVGSVKTP
jgi:hypothetical protein